MVSICVGGGLLGLQGPVDQPARLAQAAVGPNRDHGPIGRLADRVPRVRLLAVVLLVLSGGIAAMAFGSFAWAVLGCALFGIGLAAWMLPISILGRPASPRAAALRVSLHRTCVDAGVFFGPLGAGLLADAGALWVAGAFSALGLLLVGLALLAYARGEPRAQ